MLSSTHLCRFVFELTSISHLFTNLTVHVPTSVLDSVYVILTPCELRLTSEARRGCAICAGRAMPSQHTTRRSTKPTCLPSSSRTSQQSNTPSMYATIPQFDWSILEFHHCCCDHSSRSYFSTSCVVLGSNRLYAHSQRPAGLAPIFLFVLDLCMEDEDLQAVKVWCAVMSVVNGVMHAFVLAFIASSSNH